MYLRISILILCLVCFFGCMGFDGTEGEPFIEIDWIERPVYYNDSNPSLPNTITRNFFYETFPQVAFFEYGYTDGYGWVGEYEIKEGEPGTDGEIFWRDGKDGSDNFYSLILSYSGSTLSNEYKKQASMPDSISSIITKKDYYVKVSMKRVFKGDFYQKSQGKKFK